MNRRWVGLTMLLLLGPGLFATIGCRGSHSAGEGQQAATRVRYVEPTIRPITDYVYFTGRLDAVESVDVRARVTGYLEEISFKDGDEITTRMHWWMQPQGQERFGMLKQIEGRKEARLSHPDRETRWAAS